MEPNNRLKRADESGVEYIVRRVREVLAGDGTKIELTTEGADHSGSTVVTFDYGDAPRGQIDTSPSGLTVSLGPKPTTPHPMLVHQFTKVVGDTVMEITKRRYASVVLRVDKKVHLDHDLNLWHLTTIATQRALFTGGQLKSKAASYPGPVVRVAWPDHIDKQDGFDTSLRDAREHNVARLLAGMPTNLLNTTTFAESLLELFREHEKVGACKLVRGTGEPSDEQYARMGLLQAVGSGSCIPPRVIAIIVDPENGPTEKREVLVGKGLVFDNGGNNIKPDGGRGMRGDKGGACALVSVALATINNRVRLNHTTVFVFGITENALGSKAYRPDDVLVAYNGTTVEVWNTDAEGRLVLHDCISWISEILEIGLEDRVISIATLTGGTVIALGAQYTAMYLKESPWRLDEVHELEQRGIDVGDPLNILHSDSAETETLASKVADIANAAAKKERHAQQGAAFVTSAVPKDADYIHLDIAGSAGDFSGGNGCQPGTSLPGGILFLNDLLLGH